MYSKHSLDKAKKEIEAMNQEIMQIQAENAKMLAVQKLAAQWTVPMMSPSNTYKAQTAAQVQQYQHQRNLAANQMWASSLQTTTPDRTEKQYQMLERILVELSELRGAVDEIRGKTTKTD